MIFYVFVQTVGIEYLQLMCPNERRSPVGNVPISPSVHSGVQPLTYIHSDNKRHQPQIQNRRNSQSHTQHHQFCKLQQPPTDQQVCGINSQQERTTSQHYHISQQPILDVPLPPPASYNQGYQPAEPPSAYSNPEGYHGHFTKNNQFMQSPHSPFPHLYKSGDGHFMKQSQNLDLPQSQNVYQLRHSHNCSSKSLEGNLDDVISATATLPRSSSHHNHKHCRNGTGNVRMVPDDLEEHFQHYGTIRRTPSGSCSRGSRKGSRKSLTASTSDLSGLTSADGLQPLIPPEAPSKSKRESAV